jgi:hypothetical protein
MFLRSGGAIGEADVVTVANSTRASHWVEKGMVSFAGSIGHAMGYRSNGSDDPTVQQCHNASRWHKTRPARQSR